MGNYARLCVGDFTVWYMRNAVDPDVMVLFSPSENKKVEFEDEYEEYVYISTAEKIIRRLEIMGYSLSLAESAFLQGLKTIADWADLVDEDRNFLDRFTFSLWLEAVGWVIKRCDSLYSCALSLKEGMKVNLRLYPYIRFILGEHTFHPSDEADEEAFWDDDLYPGSFDMGFLIFGREWWKSQADIYHLLRGILETVPKDTHVKLDYTELIPELIDLTEEPAEKVIVLTEGRSDKEFLERSLRILYPDLVKFFRFLDFQSVNLKGGASALVEVVKSFVGAGIPNHVIALFDNDTAAWDARRGLDDISLPSNLRVLSLPDAPWAEDYPTIGPQGENIAVDINGKACSIELFFGETILKHEGDWYPVEWKGYNSALRRYQGEISRKKEVQTLFRRYLSQIEEGEISPDEIDWTGMKLVFREIFKAFA